jgi:hypothetical protein
MLIDRCGGQQARRVAVAATSLEAHRPAKRHERATNGVGGARTF